MRENVYQRMISERKRIAAGIRAEGQKRFEEIEGDPVHRLAVAYLDDSSYSPVQHDLRKPKERMLLERIRGAGAEAAIVAAAKMCEPGLDEQVAYAQALDEEEIPYFVTEFEERMSSFDHLQIQLETFVENLLFA